VEAEAAAMQEAMAAEADMVSRTEVRSPVRGTVKQLFVNTVGGVIQPGEDLIEIVPLEDNLLVEARVRPPDIAFLHPGQPAVVKVTACDFAIYGGLNAVVEDISADTITDERGESFYRVRVRTDDGALQGADEPLPIIPGMTTQVDILTGEKTVLDYLLKPILRARDRALRER
jgi:adhesin transport system membrane fusion protein